MFFYFKHSKLFIVNGVPKTAPPSDRGVWGGLAPAPGCPLRTKGGGGSSDADIGTIFWNLWCARTDKGGGSASLCGHCADKRGRLNFRDFVRTSFMDRPVTTQILTEDRQAFV